LRTRGSLPGAVSRRRTPGRPSGNGDHRPTLGRAGLLAHDDPRLTATIETIEERLADDGLVHRWEDHEEGAFLPASFWLAECHARAGRRERAEEVFARACAYANDVGLLPEEGDPRTGEALGNLPQALSHVALVNAADALR
jgi:GH15 family glucan-1,4-alpha-glucosidase